MTRLPARFARLALACSVVSFALPTMAQEAPAPAQPAAPAAPAPAAPAAPEAPAPAAPVAPAPAAPAAPEAPAPAPAPVAPAPDPATPAPPPAAPEAPAPATPAAPEAAAPAPAPPADAAPAAAPAPTAPPVVAAPSPEAELKSAVENFWHYGKIARYDLAAAEAQKVLAAKDNPVAVLTTFEQVATERKDNLDQWLLRWQGTPQLKDVSSQIMTVLNDGRRTRRADPVAIEENVKRLTTNGRSYTLAVEQLRESGELAVPILIDYLRDPAKAQYHGAVRNALRDLGRLGLNPLVAVTESKNQDLLIPVVGVLGDTGYAAAIPYLARLVNSAETPAAVKSAATQALVRMGVANAASVNPSDAFYELGEKFYYDTADITADKRDPNTPANVWYWDDTKGLVRIQVPQAIFNEIMAMRATEYSLKLGQGTSDALSLWLASNYKREAELPEGAKDPTRAENQPSAHFYGVDSGAQYLNSALARSLRDRNSQVSLRVIKSLQEIIGRTNLFTGQGFAGAPALIDAMASSDRAVRYEAAFAVAAAIPQQAFQGQERVVPLLAEAMSQTGVPSAVVVMPTQDVANGVVDALKKSGYNAVGATGADAAVAASNQLPAVDLIIVSEDMGPAQVDQLLLLSAQNAKLAGAAKLVVVKTGASPYAARAVNEPLLSVTQAADAPGLKAAADQARSRASFQSIDQAAASSYALRSADLLQKLALTQTQAQSQAFNLASAEQTVLSALADARPDVVKAAGNVLAFMNSQPAQGALLQAVLDEKTADDVKVSLLKSASVNAKFFGNRLNADQVASLDKLIEGSTNQDVKNAAGEVRGAVNLPANQAKTLIVGQSRV